MEMICSPPPPPRCALIAKALKKSRTPCSNSFGPFPDESLTAALDRLLHLLGARKFQRYFNMTTPSQESIDNECEFTVRSIESSPKQCLSCSGISSFTKGTDCSPSSCEKHYVCSKMNISPSQVLMPCIKNPCSNRGAVKDEYGCKEHSRQGVNVNILKRSFSLCSLACRKVKEKWFCSSKATTPRWLWTKVQNQYNGCQVYEVFKNSTVSSHPTHFDTCQAARIIFIILPSGIIMPFETLPSH
uniref:Uncharacterized protein n=1 Tax=Glossina palpalis gambiensis TaxID=67801 RepID=A0A1B0BG42_9MUSC